MHKVKKINASKITLISAISYQCFFTIAFSFLFLALTLIIGASNNPILFPSAFIVASICVLFIAGYKQGGLAILIGGVIIAICIVVSSFLPDYSFDGNFYHQEEVVLLTQGWNPYNIDDVLNCSSPWTWIRHYGIGIEMIDSTIVSTTGVLEAGKAGNLILVTSALGIVYAFLRENAAKGLKNRILILSAIAIVGNPVVICQMLTFYIDWSKYIFDIILLISICHLTRQWNLIDAFIGALTIVLMVATKFNIWFEACLIVAAAAIWLFATHRIHLAFKIAGWGLLSVILGVLVCYHPYYHNYIIGGHIFYPLMGEHTYDIMSSNTPEIFGQNRVFDFFRSILSISPPSVDQRFGGFGPFMAILLAISFYIIIRLHKSINKVWMYAMVLTLLSCFIFEQSWWARYICQLWLIPAMALVVLINYGAIRYLRNALLCLMLVSCLSSFAYVAYASTRMYLYRHYLYEEMAQSSDAYTINLNPQTNMQLKNHGIKCINLSKDEVPNSKRAVKFYFGSPRSSLILLDSISYMDFSDRLNRIPILSFENYDAELH